MHTKHNLRMPYCYLETKSLHNHSHQRPSVKLKMQQNKSRLGLCPRPHWGSLQHSPRPSSLVITYLPFRPPWSVIMLFRFSNVGMYDWCTRMESKEAAVRAIIATHGAQIEGYTVKCSWGKEITDSQNQQSSPSSSSSSQNQVPPPQSVWDSTIDFLSLLTLCISPILRQGIEGILLAKRTAELLGDG